MDVFQRTETVVLHLLVYSSGVLYDPDTSVKVDVTDPAATAVVTAQDATPDAVGTYHYDYAPGAAAVLGVYEVKWTVVDATRTTIYRSSFKLEA